MPNKFGCSAAGETYGNKKSPSYDKGLSIMNHSFILIH